MHLNRHLRVHVAERMHISPTRSDEDETSRQEMYCTTCNIQFSSLRNYTGHKKYYCPVRHNSKKQESPESTQRDAAAAQALAATQALANGMPPPGTVLPPGTAFPVQGILPNGSIAMPIAQSPQGMVIATPFLGPHGLTNVAFNVPTVFMPPVVDIQNSAAPGFQGSPPAANKTPITTSTPATSAAKEELPLDLSKKSTEDSTKKQDKNETISSPTSKTPNKKKESECEPEDLSTKSSSKSSKSPVQSLSSRPSTPVSQAGSHRSSPGSSRTEPALPVGVSTGVVPPATVPPHPAAVLPSPAFMAAAAAAAAMLPHQAAAFTQVAQMAAATGVNISKCAECNIVFYKHENFVIHKEHYCSGRRRRAHSGRESDTDPQTPLLMPGDRPQELMSSRSSNSSSPIASLNGATEAVSNLAVKAMSDVITVQENMLQFFCHPCKIKFSSHDTLKAHQEFYCPARGSAEGKDVTGGSRSPGSSSGGDTPEVEGNFACQYCGNCYTTNRLLKLHHCRVNSVHIPLLRCPHCDYITQSDNRLVDHIKGHAPTRAFKCTLCGYRGNTVRGMRMHGKTHIDAGANKTICWEGRGDSSVLCLLWSFALKQSRLGQCCQ